MDNGGLIYADAYRYTNAYAAYGQWNFIREFICPIGDWLHNGLWNTKVN